MLLTGEAKEDFDRWLRESYYNYYLSAYGFNPDICNYALITDWIDSIGIYIQIELWSPGSFCDPSYSVDIWYKTNIDGYPHILFFSLKEPHESRTQATKQAILKANQIYNESKN